MATVNEKLRDSAVRRRVRMLRSGTALARLVLQQLRDAEESLAALLRSRLSTISQRGASLGRRVQHRLQALLARVREHNRSVMTALGATVRGGLAEAAAVEAGLMLEELRSELPRLLRINPADPSAVRVITTSRPFQGRLLRQWIDDLGRDRQRAIEGAIRTGLMQGESTDQIVRRALGTRRLNGADGALASSRRTAEMMVRTAITGVSAQAREAVWAANEHLIEEVQWLSALESNVCPICAALDGQIFPLNSGPRPAAHPNCQCGTAPVIKSARQLGITQEEIGREARQALTGKPATAVSFRAWLRDQPVDVQREVLGATRHKLWREGKLPLDRFIDSRQNVLPLAELEKRERAAFATAGIEQAA